VVHVKTHLFKFGGAILFSTVLISSVTALPYNQYQDPIKERRIAASTWLYGQTL